MKKVIGTIALGGMLAVSATVHAGTWVKGYGETVEKATEAGLKVAKSAVKSRGTGCVDGKTRLAPKEQGLWVVEVHYSHHNGSCGKQSSDEAWVQEQVGKLVPKL